MANPKPLDCFDRFAICSTPDGKTGYFCDPDDQENNWMSSGSACSDTQNRDSPMPVCPSEYTPCDSAFPKCGGMFGSCMGHNGPAFFCSNSDQGLTNWTDACKASQSGIPDCNGVENLDYGTCSGYKPTFKDSLYVSRNGSSGLSVMEIILIVFLCALLLGLIFMIVKRF